MNHVKGNRGIVIARMIQVTAEDLLMTAKAAGWGEMMLEIEMQSITQDVMPVAAVNVIVAGRVKLLNEVTATTGANHRTV